MRGDRRGDVVRGPAEGGAARTCSASRSWSACRSRSSRSGPRASRACRSDEGPGRRRGRPGARAGVAAGAEPAGRASCWPRPGTPGSRRSARCVPVAGGRRRRASWRLVEREDVDLTVVGPEAPLVAGLADELTARGPARLRPVARRGADRGLQGLGEGRHGAPRHPDRARGRVHELGAGGRVRRRARRAARS